MYYDKQYNGFLIACPIQDTFFIMLMWVYCVSGWELEVYFSDSKGGAYNVFSGGSSGDDVYGY